MRSHQRCAGGLSGGLRLVWIGAVTLLLLNLPEVWAQSGFTTPLQVAAGEPILNEFGQVIEGDADTDPAERPLVQILLFEGEILPPDANGEPQNDLLEGGESSIGTLVSPALQNPGLFASAIASPRPEDDLQVFVRVYNKPTISNSLFYADSTNIMTVSGNTSLFAYMGGMTNILHPDRDTDADGLPDWWEHLNFAGDPVGIDPDVDYDGDTMTAMEEYIAGSDPFDAQSSFVITSIQPLYSDSYTEHVWTNTTPDDEDYGAVYTQRIYEVDGEILSWPSLAGRQYRLEYATNIVSGGFASLPEADELDATPPVNAFTNTYLPESIPVYYRARVKMAE